MSHIGKEPILTHVNRTLTPGSNFYAHINNEWLKKIKLPPYEDSYSISEEIEDNIRSQLLKVIHENQAKHPNNAVSKIATSFLTKSYQKNSLLTLQRLLSRIDCMRTVDDVGNMIGELNKIQSKAPMTILVSSDAYKTAKCCVYFYEFELGLPGKFYYKSGDNVLEKYKSTLRHLGSLFNLPNLESTSTIEQSMIPLLFDYDERNDINYTYNPHSYNALKETFPNTPWDAIFNGIGLKHTHTYIVTNTRFFHGFDKAFKTFPIEKWRIWLWSSTILSFLEYLPSPYDDMHFDLYGKLIKGIQEKIPKQFLMIDVLKRFAAQDLGKIFVHAVVPSNTKRLAIEMVENLKNATIRRLGRITWMKPSTIRKAIHKVENMKFQVAYPDKWISETKHCEIAVDQPLQNIFNLNIYDTQRMIALLDKDCKKREDFWEDGTFEANAYYYSEGNMMVIPAGILRFPFFSEKETAAWNLGAIGAAIGHEITHGFDIDGRMYDSNGNYKDWWLNEDSVNYEKITKAIVKLFDGVKYMHGEVDGELTLSENLSDLGGMAIALEALNDILGDSPEKKRKQAYIDFFTSYAISWRNKDRPKKALESLYRNSHSPAQLRVNLIVQQFAEFYIAFDIKPNEQGWIDPADRIVMW